MRTDFKQALLCFAIGSYLTNGARWGQRLMPIKFLLKADQNYSSNSSDNDNRAIPVISNTDSIVEPVEIIDSSDKVVEPSHNTNSSNISEQDEPIKTSSSETSVSENSDEDIREFKEILKPGNIHFTTDIDESLSQSSPAPLNESSDSTTNEIPLQATTNTTQSQSQSQSPPPSPINTPSSYHLSNLQRLSDQYKGKFVCTSIPQYPHCDIYLCGTLHVAKSSTDMVIDTIHTMKPHYVLLELCEARADSLFEHDKHNVTFSDVLKETYNQRSVKVFGMGLLSWMQV